VKAHPVVSKNTSGLLLLKAIKANLAVPHASTISENRLALSIEFVRYNYISKTPNVRTYTESENMNRDEQKLSSRIWEVES
jgi:hypothetical protein